MIIGSRLTCLSENGDGWHLCNKGEIFSQYLLLLTFWTIPPKKHTVLTTVFFCNFNNVKYIWVYQKHLSVAGSVWIFFLSDSEHRHKSIGYTTARSIGHATFTSLSTPGRQNERGTRWATECQDIHKLARFWRLDEGRCVAFSWAVWTPVWTHVWLLSLGPVMMPPSSFVCDCAVWIEIRIPARKHCYLLASLCDLRGSIRPKKPVH